ncbi:PP2C family protein-serine/threonine phosphatase [Streptomyces sp. TRM 70351]|uniref:PP2C family protein-serine/threonine phosphatase n=1 Tax=Streptomyces sp. TRM 70351 TaxID=3116552 RepID=UPI002E7C2C72|nr:PP2C family protein-serine/threonine phosphatase [Streptomyces sp. TRM 70351]MEE1930168.1 PP2C family protein-serine/threonine phosphatase [Streptomyces sp. TRM 70351]
MLDIVSSRRVHLEAFLAEQYDMGVCDAFERNRGRWKRLAMSTPHSSKVAGINPPPLSPEHTDPPVPAAGSPGPPPGPRPRKGPGEAPREGCGDDCQDPPRREGAAPGAPDAPRCPAGQLAAVQERLAGWLSDLSTLHDLTERLARTPTLDAALHETLRGGAALVGARRGLIVLRPADGLGPARTVGLGLGRADLGQIETVPSSANFGCLLDTPPGPAPHAAGHHAPQSHAPGPPASARPAPAPPAAPGGAARPGPAGSGEAREVAHPDIAGEDGLDARHRQVAARLGYAASYAAPLAAADPRTGAAVWLYDEPAEPTERQRELLRRYLACAGEHLARRLELARAREAVSAVREELLPSRLPRVPGVRLAVRHRAGPRGGGDWYDVLPLPEGAVGLSVGGVDGAGPGTVAVMGRLRASLRAYAVMEGEDPVAVLSDLELLLRLTEPARCATALFGYAEPAVKRVTLAGAGHCPPLIVGPGRCAFAETTLSAPLNMLACWEAPSVELNLAAGETLLLYSDGLVQRTGEPLDRALARLHAAALGAEPPVRDDPEALADHVLDALLPGGLADADSEDDVVLLAARF